MATLEAELSKDVLQTLDRWSVPVDPFLIAKDEEIELAPGTFGKGFDARIEYVPEIKRFVIYYRLPGSGRPKGRVNFSIAHELGHFYLPHHRAKLLAGEMHNSVADYRSSDKREAEADEFAANLLMPKELFTSEVSRFRQRVCTLSEICQLAECKLGTSVTSTARRYCECDIEACSIVLSERGVVKWAMHSSDMKGKNMGYIPFRQPVPRTSKTAELLKLVGEKPIEGTIDGSVEAKVWFERPFPQSIWEDAMLLGGTGFALTMLTPDSE